MFCLEIVGYCYQGEYLHGQGEVGRRQADGHLPDEQEGLCSCLHATLPKDLQNLLQELSLCALRGDQERDGGSQVAQQKLNHSFIRHLACRRLHIADWQ